MLRACSLAIGLALLLAAPDAPIAQTGARPSLLPGKGAPARPTWAELTPAQRTALAPLASDWDALDADRKQKWLEVAEKYPRMSPEAQQRMHARMAEFARLTPEQKRNVRENFQRFYELPPEQRQRALQEYQELSPEKKKELADQAARRKAEAAGKAPR